jgi:AcrR family transcriptional regulator
VFAERGYRGASMDEIARRSGVSAPVVYDHFASKKDLHRRLLESHFADLREVWRENMRGDDPPEKRVARSFDAWFGYVESHPYAWRMLFSETTGDPEVEAVHREVAAESRALVLPLLARETGPSDELMVEMAWEAMRGVLQGLALWWYEHREVPRAQVVAVAMNVLWVGFEGVLEGDVWLS